MIAVYLEWTTSGTSHNHTATLESEKTIGRNSDNTFVVSDPKVSGRQATLRQDHASVIIKNVSETNRIKVGGAVVDLGGSATLRDNMLIDMGSTQLFTRIVTFENDVDLNANCTNCSKPIPEGTQVCPWCGATQSSTQGITML